MTNPAPQAKTFTGLFNPLGLSLFQAPKEGAKGIPALIKWSDYTTVKDASDADCKAVKFDLSQLGKSFSQIGSFYVDNLNCSVSALIYFNDTQTWYQIAARTSGFVPVTTNGLRFTVQTLGLPLVADNTNFIILNVFTPPDQTGLTQTIISGQPVVVDFGGNPQPVLVTSQPIQTNFGGIAQPVTITGQPVQTTFSGISQPVGFGGIAQPILVTAQPIQTTFSGIAQPVGFGGIAQPVTIGSQPVQIRPEDLAPGNLVANGAPGNIGITNYVLLAIGAGARIYGFFGCINLFANGGAQTICTFRLTDNARLLWSYTLTFAPGAANQVFDFGKLFMSPVIRQTAGPTVFTIQVNVGAVAVGGWNTDFGILTL